MSDAQIRTAKLTDLTPDAENANAGTDRGRAMLDKSLRDHCAGPGSRWSAMTRTAPSMPSASWPRSWVAT